MASKSEQLYRTTDIKKSITGYIGLHSRLFWLTTYGKPCTNLSTNPKAQGAMLKMYLDDDEVEGVVSNELPSTNPATVFWFISRTDSE